MGNMSSPTNEQTSKRATGGVQSPASQDVFDMENQAGGRFRGLLLDLLGSLFGASFGFRKGDR